jgi:release factor glutamine methyltransferase
MRNISEIINFIDTTITNNFVKYDAYQLLADRLGVARNTLRTSKDLLISTEQATQFERDLKELMDGKPLHRILGYRFFWKDKFELSFDTLEPRPDTETLIEVCLKYFPIKQKDFRILDLGTGSGCILSSLLQEYPNATGVGVDISEGALEMAKCNAEALGISSRVEWVQSDWLANVHETFDIIISNPPYIPSVDIESLSTEVQTYDPLKALDGGQDGLDAYRILAQQLPNIVKENTLIILEIGYDQGISVPELFSNHGYKVVALEKDYGGNHRCVVLKKLQ